VILVLASGYEWLLEGPPAAGASRRGPRDPQDVVETFSVSLPMVKRWLRRRETGGVEARTIPGRPSKKGTALRGWLPGRLASEPDATLAEHCEAFEEAHGLSVSTAPR
jgi:transposase